MGDKYSKLSIISFVLSIVGILLIIIHTSLANGFITFWNYLALILEILCFLLAIIFGIISFIKIKKNKKLKGKAFSIIGFLIGLVSLLFFILLTLAISHLGDGI